MTTQPDALRLADALYALMDEETLVGAKTIDKAAAELRSLYEANNILEADLGACRGMNEQQRLLIEELKQNNEILIEREQHWRDVFDVEVARVDPLMARLIKLEKALGMAVEALESAREHVIVYTEGPWQDVDDQCREAIATARQTLGGAA